MVRLKAVVVTLPPVQCNDVLVSLGVPKDFSGVQIIPKHWALKITTKDGYSLWDRGVVPRCAVFWFISGKFQYGFFGEEPLSRDVWEEVLVLPGVREEDLPVVFPGVPHRGAQCKELVGHPACCQRVVKVWVCYVTQCILLLDPQRGALPPATPAMVCDAMLALGILWFRSCYQGRLKIQPALLVRAGRAAPCASVPRSTSSTSSASSAPTGATDGFVSTKSTRIVNAV